MDKYQRWICDYVGCKGETVIDRQTLIRYGLIFGYGRHIGQTPAEVINEDPLYLIYTSKYPKAIIEKNRRGILDFIDHFSKDIELMANSKIGW